MKSYISQALTFLMKEKITRKSQSVKHKTIHVSNQNITLLSYRYILTDTKIYAIIPVENETASHEPQM